jgi:hypothetical protein
VCLEPAAQGGHEKEADMRRTQLITTAALVAACAVPATAAAKPIQELRSPDTRDAAAAAEAQSYQDLRSPDARDAATPGQTGEYMYSSDPDSAQVRAGSEPTTQVTQDLRSPDARDAGRAPVQVPQPVVEIREAPGNGFDWADAGIGAAGMFALFSIAAGVALTLGGRRRRGVGMPAH